MADNIVTKSHIEQKAINAFRNGMPRDSHNMNWHAAALPVWLAAYDQAAQASPLSHIAPHRRGRVDASQAAA